MKSPEQSPNFEEEANHIENNDETQNIIPPQYKGLPSEVVEELWTKIIYPDPKKTEAENIRREKAIQEIKNQEKAKKIKRNMAIPEQHIGEQETENAKNDHSKNMEVKEKPPTTPEDNMDIIKSDLKKLAEDHYLILHQSWDDSAKTITESSEYFSDTGLQGTAIINQDVNTILSIFKQLDKPSQEQEHSTHAGANSMVILAFPKNLIDDKKHVLDRIDSVLIDKMMNKEIKEFGLPRNFVFGYYYNGVFNKNNDFNPEFIDMANKLSEKQPDSKQLNNSIENTREKPMEKVDKILFDLERVLSIEDKETQKQTIKAFIKKRIKELEQGPPEKFANLSGIGEIAVGEFIRSDTEIRQCWLYDPYKINDPEIYTKLLKSFKKIYQSSNKPESRPIIERAIMEALDDYFGSDHNTENRMQQSSLFYNNHTTDDSEPINLSEFKGKDIAVCSERAPVAHNYLKFFGLDSHLIFSKNYMADCVLEESTVKEKNIGHVFIVIAEKDEKFIFEPTNPVLEQDSKSKVQSVQPALFKISDEDYLHLLKRDKQQVAVEHIDQIIDDEGNRQPQKAQIRTYG